jgi:ankyrin repeat protein
VTNVELEQPFRTDVDYYEERAYGISTVNGVEIDEARSDLARRHGFESWTVLLDHLDALRDGSVPPTPFMLAYRAVEDGDVERLTNLIDAHPDLVHARGTNGNDLLGMSGGRLDLTRLLIERGADVNRGNDYGWTILHQAGYGNDRGLAQIALDAGADPSLSARGDGGTPLIAALFWGHRRVVDLLGLDPGNLRVAAGLGRLEMIRELVGTPQAGAHRAFFRPHGGFPAWVPSDDPQEVLDEALVWAAKADRSEAIALLVELGARIEADVYRGTPLVWAAANGRVDAIRTLLSLGADVNQRATFGGPTHGDGVVALHLAAQGGHTDAVEALLEGGADPTLRDLLHNGPASGWAEFGGHLELAKLLAASART